MTTDTWAGIELASLCGAHHVPHRLIGLQRCAGAVYHRRQSGAMPRIFLSPGSLDDAPQRHRGAEGSLDDAPQRHKGTKGMRVTPIPGASGQPPCHCERAASPPSICPSPGSLGGAPQRHRGTEGMIRGGVTGGGLAARHLPVTGIVGWRTTEARRHRGDDKGRRSRRDGAMPCICAWRSDPRAGAEDCRLATAPQSTRGESWSATGCRRR